MQVREALRKRFCNDCGHRIERGSYCLEVIIGGKKRSFCVDCVLNNTIKLLKHHNVQDHRIQELKEEYVELRI
jgi:hypothetical protein